MDYTKLKSEIQSIKNGRERYKKETQQNSRCDKYGFGFNKDSRFSGFKINLSLDSWLGYYGDSGCSTAVQFGEGFSKHFVKFLDVQRDVIIDSVLERMEDELKTYLEAEIEKTQKYLETLKATQD